MRFQLHHAEDSQYIIAKQRYTDPQALKITKVSDGSIIRPTILKDGVSLGASDVCGANLYYADLQTVEFKLTGDASCDIHIELTNAVKGSTRYEIDIDEFFDKDGPTAFIDNIAYVLGIDHSRIRITSVQRGSTIIYFDIDGSQQPSSLNDTTTHQDIQAELDNIKRQLEQAIEEGKLNVLNSTILDYSFEITMKSYNPDVVSEAGTVQIAAMVIGILLGVIAIGLGIVGLKYYQNKKKRVAGNIVQKKYSLSKNPDASSVIEKINDNGHNVDKGITSEQVLNETIKDHEIPVENEDLPKKDGSNIEDKSQRGL